MAQHSAVPEATAADLARWLLRVLRRVRVTGESMAPTLVPGTVVLADMRAYRGDAVPAVGDIVIAVHPHSGIEIIKRVENVSAEGVFVVSDNTDALNVSDSRIFGAIPANAVTGKVIAQLGSGLNN